VTFTRGIFTEGD